MKNLILYFTGTGNTYYVAKQMSDYLDEVKIIRLSKSSSKDEINKEIEQSDTIGILYPVYAGNIPYLVKDYIEMLEFGEKLNNGDLNDLVKPFYRKEEDRSKEGYGLGLAITNKIIELHGFKLGIQIENVSPYNKSLYIDLNYLK